MNMMPANFKSKRRAGFTLVELLIVVAVIAIVAMVAVPNWLRARKRSQASRILDDLRALDHAMEQYAVEHHRTGSEPVYIWNIGDFIPYLKTGTALYSTLPNDFFGNSFGVTTFTGGPKLSPATFVALSDVAPVDFWSPYYP